MPIIKRCKICDNEFKTKQYFLNIGRGIYCSNKCSGLAKRNGKNIKCHLCKKDSYKKQIEISRSKSKKYFCSKSCQTKWRNQEFIGDKHANWKDGLYAYRSVLKRHKTKKECKLCKTNDIRVLAVHHIDKNRKNNKVENLAYLCHNCHHLVHHYDLDKELS